MLTIINKILKTRATLIIIVYTHNVLSFSQVPGNDNAVIIA